MPEIRFVQLTCPDCGTTYKVRLERIRAGDPIECVTCGRAVDVRSHLGMLQLLHQYSVVAIEIEKGYRVDGDTVIPLTLEPPSPSRKLVTW